METGTLATESKPAPDRGVDRIIAIDWSGRIDAAGQRRHIWAGVWTRGAKSAQVKLEAGRTRDEVGDWLIALAKETPRLAIGIDCCFSFPAWFLAEHGCTTVFDFWRHVAAGQGERWLKREAEDVARDERFWGAPHKRPEQLSGANLHRGMRLTDWDNKIDPSREGGEAERAARLAKMRGITPKSPFQIGGSGTVGTGSLRAMPVLLRLHEAGFRVWPYESASFGARPRPLLVEMYTRLMTGPVAKSNPAARKLYLATRRKSDPLYAPLTRSVLRKAEGSEDAFDALVSTLEMVRHAGDLPTLRATRNPTLRLEGETWRPGIGG
jgi:hypothetical protein